MLLRAVAALADHLGLGHRAGGGVALREQPGLEPAADDRCAGDAPGTGPPTERRQRGLDVGHRERRGERRTQESQLRRDRQRPHGVAVAVDRADDLGSGDAGGCHGLKGGMGRGVTRHRGEGYVRKVVGDGEPATSGRCAVVRMAATAGSSGACRCTASGAAPRRPSAVVVVVRRAGPLQRGTGGRSRATVGINYRASRPGPEAAEAPGAPLRGLPGVRRPSSTAAVMMAGGPRRSRRRCARGRRRSPGAGPHRSALVEHGVGGPAADRAGEEPQQLGVAQRVHTVPLEAFARDEARGARAGFRCSTSCAAAVSGESAPPPPPSRSRPGHSPACSAARCRGRPSHRVIASSLA